MTTVAASMLLDGPAATLALAGTAPAASTAGAGATTATVAACRLRVSSNQSWQAQPQEQQQRGWDAVRCRSRRRSRSVQANLKLQTDSTSSSAATDDDTSISYATLEQHLQSGAWELADAETRRLLIVLAGEAAQARGWVYYSEVKTLPTRALQTLDELWRRHSGGKFGYSVQRRVWESVDRSCTRFFRKVAWTRPLNDKVDAYKKFPMEFTWDAGPAAPEGHLPLTNCLRGTLLLTELLQHPAFAEVAGKEEAELGGGLGAGGNLMENSLKGLF